MELQPLIPIFQKYGVAAYLCGHDHHMEHLERDGMHFFVSGAGSKTRAPTRIEGTRFSSAESGFLFASILPPRADAVPITGSDGSVAREAPVSTPMFLWQFIDQRGN